MEHVHFTITGRKLILVDWWCLVHTANIMILFVAHVTIPYYTCMLAVRNIWQFASIINLAVYRRDQVLHAYILVELMLLIVLGLFSNI